ncbi:MAG: SET domain-containing protein-lysine N-methyltransferase [Promethearchaeota archaeon]
MEILTYLQDCSYGKGIVANTSLNAGTAVQKYEGSIVPWEQVPNDEIRYAILVSDDQWMIIKTDARYINHSCDPNCIINESLEVVTIRPVNKDEEITVRYNVVYKNENPGMWDNRWSFKCLCGSKICQGVIDKYINEDGSEWKPSGEY